MYSNIICGPSLCSGLAKEGTPGFERWVKARGRAPSHDAPCAVARRAPCVSCASCASRVRARAPGFKLTACGSPAHPPAKPAHPPRRVLRGLRIVRWTSPLIVVRGRVARPAQGRKITEFLFVAMGPFGFYRTDALRSLLAQCSLIASSLLVHCSAIARSLLVHCSWRAVV